MVESNRRDCNGGQTNMRDDQTPPISEIAVQRFTKSFGLSSVEFSRPKAVSAPRLSAQQMAHGPLHHMRKRSNIKGPEVYEWHDP